MTSALAVPPRTGWLNILLLRADYWRLSAAHRAGRLLLLAAYLYLAIAIALFASEDWLLYHACPASRGWYDPPPELHAQDIDLTTADGTPIHAWWCVPEGWQPAQGAMLFAHGNGGNISFRSRQLLHWRQQTNLAVLAFDYPGFGRSGGSPSEAGCYAAADAAYDWLTTSAKVPGKHVILCGGSLGGAVAVDLARRKRCRVLVLISTFANFPELAQQRFPWLPARWLVHNQFNNLAKLADCSCPVLIAHSPVDDLIPFEHGRRLYEAARGPKQFVMMDGYPHQDFPNDAFYSIFRHFLEDNARAQLHPAD
jgi:fermentation-respiration switch protein FrsA (DUF1100 family)